MTDPKRTQINHDAFARESLYRERVYFPALAHPPGCAWCGRTSCSPLAKNPYLFRYSVHTDGGATHPDKKLFCGIDCRRAYNAH